MNKKLKKHIVIDARIRRASTGRPVERFLRYLPSLDKDNNYTVLVDPADDVLFDAPNIKVLPCKYKRFSMNPLQQMGFAWMLYKLRPSLVFFTQTGLTPLLYFGKNITFTHDLTMLRFARAGKLPHWLHQVRMIGYRLLFWKGNIFANRILVPSKFVADDLVNYLPRTKAKITVTYEAGVLPVKAKGQKIKDKRLNGPFIFHVGSPLPHKNINNLVLAFEQLKNDFPELKLVLAGKKEYYFQQLTKWLRGRKYEDDILVTGFITDEELKWLYENAEAYVLPCYSEGFGLPGLEAMTNGCPLASSNATCLPEVYAGAALYFDPDSPKEMAEVVKKIMTSQKLKKDLISKGHQQVKKYSWKKMSKEILNVIEEVLYN